MRKIAIIIFIICIITQPAYSYWVWTPESGKWENPKYAAKDTPEEQLEYALNFYKEKKFKSGLREFKKLLKVYPLSKEASTAQYYIGRIMEDLDKPYDAFKAYQKVIDLYPYTELVDTVIEREFKIGELFFSGKKLSVLGPFKVQAKDKAIEIFNTVSENAPYGKYAALALFKAGLAYKSIKDHDNAILTFKDLIDKYPSSDIINDARYELAVCSKSLSLKSDYDQTPTKVARKEFEDFIKKHPHSDVADGAKKVINDLKHKEAENVYNIGQFYEERKMPKSAVIYYQDILVNYSDTEWVKKANDRLNEIENK